MPSPRDLREREVQRRADVVNATIVERNDDGTYDCTDSRTGQTFRASKANRNDEFSPGTRVVVAPTGNSRRTVGAGAVIKPGIIFGIVTLRDWDPSPFFFIISVSLSLISCAIHAFLSFIFDDCSFAFKANQRDSFV